MAEDTFKPIAYVMKIPSEIKVSLDSRDIWIIENIGIPNKIAPLGGIKYEILSIPYEDKDKNLIFGKTGDSSQYHYLLMEIPSKIIYHQWNYNILPERVFINSSIEQMLLSNCVYTFFIRRLILSEALGPYYDNTSTGGNFEKYAVLLEEMIQDIDKRAAKEGVWHSLIEEMKLGVI